MSTTTEITTTTEEPTMIASAAPEPTTTYITLPAPTHFAEIEAMSRDTLEAYGMRRAIGGYRRKGDDELRRLVALAYGVPVPAAGEVVVEVESLQVEIDETADDEIEIPDTRTAYGEGEVEDDDGDEPVEVEAIETTPQKAPSKPAKSRRLSPEVKAARAAERAAKREQAKLEREARKLEKRAAREALAATRKIERERRAAEKAKAKNDKAVATLTDLKIEPTDDYKDRARGVMRAAHAVARLAVDAGSDQPYRREMGNAMRALWGRLKAKETILGGDYLPAVEEAQKATVEPVDAIDEIVEAITLTAPRDAIDDIDDELGASDFYGLI